jgi:plastocyanin
MEEREPNRRHVLLGGVAGLGLLAGCVGTARRELAGATGANDTGANGMDEATAADESTAATTAAGEGTEAPPGTADATNGSAPANGTDETADVEAGEVDEVVEVGPGGEFVFEPETLRVEPGATVEFVWVSDGHNVAVESRPESADWRGHAPIEDGGFSAAHTFEAEGVYEFACEPHESVGMAGRIVVGDGTATAAANATVAKGTPTVTVGADGNLVFEPAELTIAPGTAVEFVWESDDHNVAPEEGDWGHTTIEDAGFGFTTSPFEETGEFPYVCEPHAAAGMEGSIEVVER